MSVQYKITSKIVVVEEKRLVGKKLIMSFADYKIGELWKSFLSEKNKISNNLSDDLISMTIYKPDYFDKFNPINQFEKWAAIEVTDFNNVPDNMNSFVLSGGLYAIFDYKGSSADNSVFEYILKIWLPNSEYLLDDRPHFEVLGEKYQNNDPNSEEKIYIPIKHKF